MKLLFFKQFYEDIKPCVRWNDRDDDRAKPPKTRDPLEGLTAYHFI